MYQDEIPRIDDLNLVLDYVNPINFSRRVHDQELKFTAKLMEISEEEKKDRGVVRKAVKGPIPIEVSDVPIEAPVKPEILKAPTLKSQAVGKSQGDKVEKDESDESDEEDEESDEESILKTIFLVDQKTAMAESTMLGGMKLNTRRCLKFLYNSILKVPLLGQVIDVIVGTSLFL